MNKVLTSTKHAGQAALGSAPGRSLLRAAQRFVGSRVGTGASPAFRLAQHAIYPSRAGFEYHRAGCAPITLGFGGAPLSLYFLGDYEPETLGPVVELAKQARVFLDIGAQAGVYSLVVASANRDVEVFAFEANPAAAELLVENARRNAGKPGVGSVQVCAIAVADEPGLATFHLAGGNSSLNGSFRSRTQALTCMTVSIDSFLQQVDPEAAVDLVKIDTESTEPDVLEGMRRTIERCRPVIALEVLRGRTEERLDQFLAASDYGALWLRPSGPEPVTSVRGDAAHVDLNYLFVPQEKLGDVCARLARL